MLLINAFFEPQAARADYEFLPTQITENNTDNSHTDAIIDDLDNIHLAYERDGVIYYRYNNLEEESISAGTFPSLGIGSNHTPIIVFANDGIVYSARRDGADAWTSAAVADGDYGDIAIDDQGKIHIAYIYSSYDEDGNSELLYISNVSGNFGNPSLIADGIDGISDYSLPNIKLDQAGIVHIAYNKIAGDNSQVLAYTGGNTDELPVFSWMPGQGIGKNGLALDASGLNNISYARGGNIYLAAETEAGEWSEAALTIEQANANSPALDINGGYIGVAYSDGGSINFLENADNYSSASFLNDGDAPVLALKSDNEAHIYLIYSDGNNNEIWEYNNDKAPPLGTVSLSQDLIYEGDLVQEVTVSYNEVVNLGGDAPAITFSGLEGEAVYRGDGGWDADNKIWTGTYDLSDADEETAQVQVISSGAEDQSDNVQTDSAPAYFQIDTLAPQITGACVSLGTSTDSVYDGGSGQDGAFIIGDNAVGRWDNENCDHIEDVGEVYMDLSNFHSGDNQLRAATSSSHPDIWTAAISGSLDETESNNSTLTISVYDQAGNLSELTPDQAFTVDTVYPDYNESPFGSGDNDYALASGQTADLVFTELLSPYGKTQVERSLNTGADYAPILSWNDDAWSLRMEGNSDFGTVWNNDVYAHLWDPAGNSHQVFLIDSAPAGNQLEASSTVLLNTAQNQVIVNGSGPLVVNIPIEVTDAALDLSPLTATTSGTLTAITINATTSLGAVRISIADGTTVTAGSGWNGIMNAPQIKATTTVSPAPDSGKTANTESVIEVGFNDVGLEFDRSVRISIAGQAGKYAGYSRSGVFHPITLVCDSDEQSAVDAQLAGSAKECKKDAGGDLIIWTKHFTKFATYTQTSDQTDNNGGGGGIPPTPCVQADYSAWGECRNGKQFRNLISVIPANCSLTSRQQAERFRLCPIDIGENKKQGDQPEKKQKNTADTIPKKTAPAVKGFKLYADGTLLRAADKRIYVISQGKKKHILNLASLKKYFFGRPIINVPMEELDRYQTIKK